MCSVNLVRKLGGDFEQNSTHCLGIHDAHQHAVSAGGVSAAINLLINTWEAISVLVLDFADEDKNFIFGILPVLYMFTELNDAIEVIGCKIPAYAANFRLLSKQQLEWLKFKDDHYQTGEKAGMHALFG